MINHVAKTKTFLLTVFIVFLLELLCFPKLMVYAEDNQDSPQSIEINGLEEGCEVSYYKVAEYNNGTGFKWLISKANLPKIEGLTSDFNAWTTDEANLIVQRAVNELTPETVTASSSSALLSVTSRGIWAATVCNATNASKVYQNMILPMNNATGHVEVNVKSSEVSIEKSAQDKSVGVGEDAKFDIKTTEAVYSDTATNRIYQITDFLPKGLTFKTIDSVSSQSTTFTLGEDYYFDSENNEVTVTFTPAAVKKFTTGETITTVLVATREPGYDGTLTNQAKLTFSDDSFTSNETTIKTSAENNSEAKIYDFDIQINKVSADTSKKALTGAKFSLLNLDTNKYINYDGSSSEEAFGLDVDENGVLTIAGLDEASYELKETVAPDGYIITNSPIQFTVNATYDGKTLTGYTISGDRIAEGTISENQNLAIFDVTNTKQGVLPATGDNGTILFILGGIMLVSIGVILLCIQIRKTK